MLRRLRPLLRHARVENELDTELRFHIESRVAALIADGMSADEARRRVRLEFGGLDQTKDECRDARSVALLESIGQDFRFGLRSLRKSPVFTAVAVLSLALGIGANTAIFSLLDQVLVRPLPVRNPQELVMFRSFGPNPGMDRNSGRKMSFSYAKYKEFRDRGQSFSGVIARYGEDASLSYAGQSDKIMVELVSGNYFQVLGVDAAAGRVLTPEDDKTWRAEPYAVLSYEYWVRRFGANKSIIGKAVQINDTVMTVVGVSAKHFYGVQRGVSYDVRVPMMMKAFITPTWPRINEPSWAWLNILARLKPGVSLEQAEAEGNVLYRQLLQNEAAQLQGAWLRQREEFLHRKLDLLPAGQGITWNTEQMSTAMLALMAMVGLVLLIACVNIASLLMARTVARARETAVRLVLGAGRLRIARQFVVESLLLAAAGAVLGLLIALSIGHQATTLLFGQDAVNVFSVNLDVRVLAFNMAVAVLTALLFGVATLIQKPAPLSETLKSESGSSASPHTVRIRKCLVILQVAFCVLLMIGAGLFTRTLHNLRNLDLGFEQRNLITFSMDASLAGYDRQRSDRAYRNIVEKLRALPGVDSVAASSYGVLKGNTNVNRYAIDGFVAERPEDTNVREIAVTPGYVRTVGLKLVSGREFQEADYDAGRAVIVNEAFAKRYYNGADPVGRVLHAAWGSQPPPLQVVGMIRNEKYSEVREEAQPSVYVPVLYPGSVTFYVRTSRKPAAAVLEIQKTAKGESPGVPVYDVRTMQDQVDAGLQIERMIATLAACFGALAMLLAAIGLYGVISYVVATRTREIGVRLALGAARTRVFVMVMKDVAFVLAGGLILGVLGGLIGARYVQASLYGVNARDPLVLLIAVAVCAAVSAVAGFIPAGRATRIDPVRALRWE